MKKKLLSVLLCTTMAATMIVGCGTGESSTSENSEKTGKDDGDFSGTTLSILVDSDTFGDGIQAVIELAKEKYGMEFEIEYRQGGAEGDNMIKTRLSSGDMADICIYNSGALFAALNPSEYFADLSDNDTIMSRLDETYASTVTVDGATYGIPLSSTQVGAVLYNKAVYEKYELEVPETWDEFIANCDTLKEAGETAVIGSFADDWTSQVILLGDNANVMKQDPGFVERLSKGEDNYAKNPYALRSFEKMSELTPYYNEDYLSTTYNDACDMIAGGAGAHWIILTGSLTNIYQLYGDEINNIGVFAIPADDAENTRITTWMPPSLYANKNSENLEAVKAFFEFYVSDEALDCYTEQVLPDGPYAIKGYELPDKAYKAVSEDMQAYFDEGKTGLAAEFLTDIKGSNSMAICQECGSGQTTAEEAAKKYDDDCKLQAQQLGYEWAQ